MKLHQLVGGSTGTEYRNNPMKPNHVLRVEINRNSGRAPLDAEGTYQQLEPIAIDKSETNFFIKFVRCQLYKGVKVKISLNPVGTNFSSSELSLENVY